MRSETMRVPTSGESSTGRRTCMRRWAPEYMVHPFFKKNGTLVVSLPTRVRCDGSRSARAGKVSPVLAEGSARWHERVYICGSTREMCLFRVVLRLVFITGERFEPWPLRPICSRHPPVAFACRADLNRVCAGCEACDNFRACLRLVCRNFGIDRRGIGREKLA